MVRTAVIGCGRWGMNYIRVLGELPCSRVDYIYDSDGTRMEKALERFPSVKAAAAMDELIDAVDAVVVATPASTHHEIVKKALSRERHVLVEKPIALTVEDTLEMIDLARSRGKVLMVGHTFLFNSGIKKLKECIKEPSFGKVHYLYATRTNMGPIRHDVNALWDLATHDVSIFNYLLDSRPEWVSATGSKLFGNGREDVCFITLAYPSNVIANIHVSWADPYKVREVVAVGSRRRVVFDDLESLERIKIFEKGVLQDHDAMSYGEFRLLMRDGDILSPRIENREPLREQCAHFIRSVEENESKILSDGVTGLNVIAPLIAADRSLKMHGAPVEVPSIPYAAPDPAR